MQENRLTSLGINDLGITLKIVKVKTKDMRRLVSTRYPVICREKYIKPLG
jgi:hypothetical protein